MELSCHWDWIPKNTNREADALSNSCFAGFSGEFRVPCDFESLSFKVLHKLQTVGR